MVDNKHPSVLSKHGAQSRTSSPQACHNATTPGMRLVSLAQLRKTYVTAMLMHDIGAVQVQHRRCATYARAQLMSRPAQLNVAPIKLFGLVSHLCHALTQVMSLPYYYYHCVPAQLSVRTT